ncbi:hypothetical protein NVS89_04505 [Ancylobacter sp. MQZ15Z-1]|uniref:Uncharacterized protein n=1 Tax=Ancylobacter mangrovi TaxID=2972472 RepID=A0A9X2T5X6_9HYPH|nr:hypothetical protein [Ancylobacter mangrovi]MCS0494348.1 hypothetical protein [Ancylobacter mangrovi]
MSDLSSLPVPSRRQALCLGAAAVAAPIGLLGQRIPPQERLAQAMREIEEALAEIYPGAFQRPIFELPSAEEFASPILADGSFMSGTMAMVSVSANSFHERFAAGLSCREDPRLFGGRTRT